MLSIDTTQPAIRREDLFGPLPAPRAATGAGGRADRALHQALARLLLRLAAQDWRAAGEVDPLIEALRAEIDAAADWQRHMPVRAHPLLEAWLPRVGSGGSFCELALLVESIAVAAPAERASWGRRLFMRFGSLVAEEMVHLAEREGALVPVLRGMVGEAELRAVTLRMMAEIPPAHVQAFLVLTLPAMEADTRAAFIASALAAAEDDAATAAIRDATSFDLAA